MGEGMADEETGSYTKEKTKEEAWKHGTKTKNRRRRKKKTKRKTKQGPVVRTQYFAVISCQQKQQRVTTNRASATRPTLFHRTRIQYSSRFHDLDHNHWIEERSKHRCRRRRRKDREKMMDWWASVATVVLTLLGYVSFFWKINWVRGLQENPGSKRGAAGYLGTKHRKFGNVPPVYPNGWFALLESCQLAKGQVKHVAALGENFAVFRSEKGQAYILNAYCPHLGANMAEGGTVKGDCLQCPFHDWQFNGSDGVCQSIPYTKKVPVSAKTKAWKCCEVNTIIFVWYHAESTEPNWQPEPLESIGTGDWWYHGRNEFLINCHIQEIPENGADWAHLNAVHGPGMFFENSLPGLMRHRWSDASWAPRTRVNDSTPSSHDRENSANSGNSEKSDATTVSSETIETTEKSEDKRHLATLTLSHEFVLFGRFSFLKLRVVAEQIGPGYVELILNTTFGPVCILQTVTPLEPMLQRVTHLIFAAPLLGPYARIIFLGECLMFARDISVWNHKKFEKTPNLVREDRSILAYRRWYGQFYSPRSPTLQTIKSLEW